MRREPSALRRLLAPVRRLRAPTVVPARVRRVASAVLLVLASLAPAGSTMATAEATTSEPVSAVAKSPWPGGKWQPDPATYGSTTVANVPIVMSDGVTLIGDVEYPADLSTGQRASGRFPVLLAQNPYQCDAPIGSSPANPKHDFFVQRGYVFATVCVRGTGRSGGDFGWFSPRDQQDGPELVDWAAHHLSGSSGTVGLSGCSYLGMNQLSTAGRVSPNSGLKEISPFCTGSEEYREAFMGSGMPTETGNFFNAISTLIGPRAGAWGALQRANILSGGDEAYNGPFWQVRAQAKWVPQIVRNGIPALFWSGWRDVFPSGAEDMYAYFQNAYAGRPVYGPMNPEQRATGRYQIVVGPWGHGEGIDQNIQLEWYDTWLKGQETEIDDTRTPMHLWDLGAKHWINAASFPLTDDYSQYFLHPSGGLTPKKPTSVGSAHVLWAQPTVAGSTLTYTTQPFARGVTVAGPIGARLYASSTNKNLELIATLQDLAPEGSTSTLTSGWVIGSLAARDPRRSWYDERGLPIHTYCLCDKDVYLTPGQARAFDFGISPRIATLEPGHALRLILSTQTPSSTCAAGFLGVDPCTPTAPQARTLPGTYTIVSSPAAPSSINLPLLPRDHFKSAGSGPVPLDWGRD